MSRTLSTLAIFELWLLCDRFVTRKKEITLFLFKVGDGCITGRICAPEDLK